MGWVNRYLELAEFIASWSKDPSRKVGAVIISSENNRVVSTGYNGFPAKVEDSKERLENREDKLLYTVHAELNAILAARNFNLKNCTIYSTLFPCAHCMGAIIQSGINRVVTYTPDETNFKWEKHFEASRNMALEAGITIQEIDKL